MFGSINSMVSEMKTLTEKIALLPVFMEQIEKLDHDEAKYEVKLMRLYQASRNCLLEANIDLVEYLDGVAADKIPATNGFLNFMNRHKASA